MKTKRISNWLLFQLARCKLNQYIALILVLLTSQFLTRIDLVYAATKEEGKHTESAFVEKPRSSEWNKPEKVDGATISGKILIQGKTPLANGVVFLFDNSTGPPPSRLDKYWRVPDRITTIDKYGDFLFEVNEGIYYLTAAQKDPDTDVGPPQFDEFHYFHGDEEGTPRAIIVTSGGKLNLGVLVPFLWSPATIQREKGITAVEGVVSDLKGLPVAGALVFAYLSSNISGRPIFISDKTDKNGKYLLRFHDGGTFYLKVRSVYGGGAPEAGEFLNTTEEFKPFSVSLKKDQRLQGINLQVKKFPKRGPKGTKFEK